MNTNAFRLYDIRGFYPSQVNEQLAFNLGRVLTSWKSPKKVAIAGDIRKSTPSLKKYLIDGFGAEVELYDLGEVPVPEFYFTIATQCFDLGVMITASHLHADENGFKFVGPNGLPFNPAELEKLKKLISNLNPPKIVVPKRKVESLDVTNAYIDELLRVSGLKNIICKLVLDTTRSSTSTVVPQIMNKLQANYSLTKNDHEGNPLLPENRKDLVDAVRLKKADLGIIWDSDGDRVAFVDSSGEFIPMSFVLAILASDEIRKNHGGKVAVDVRAGLVVRDMVERAGGTVEVFPAWHVNIKFAMQDNPDFVFGGETAGHFMYRDFHKIDDGILAALKFIDYCQQNDLKETLQHLKNRYFELPEMNFKVPLEKATQILENLANDYREKGNKVSLIDGLTVFGSDWKFNLRSSATEPLLRLNLESNNEQQAKKIIDSLSAHL